MSKKTKKKKDKELQEFLREYVFFKEDEPNSVLGTKTDLLNMSDHGVFLGLSRDNQKTPKYYGLPQGADGNIAVIGSSGSGKTFGNVFTTLETFNGAICCLDLKGEIADRYLKLYSQGFVSRPPIIFDPSTPNGWSYAPFSFIKDCEDADLLSYIKEIMLLIVPNEPDAKDPFWYQSEQAVLTSALLFFYEKGLSFSESICKIFQLGLMELCKLIDAGSNEKAKGFIKNITKLKEETLFSIELGLRNKLQHFVDERILNALNGAKDNCFTWDDLAYYNIFIRIPQDKVEQWGVIAKLLLNHLVHHLERRPEKYGPYGSNNIQTLLLLDEFPRLGKMNFLLDAVSTLRSKSVNICLLMQSFAQLDFYYGQDARRVILDNCQYVAILEANDPDSQRYLSDKLGTIARVRESHSYNYNAGNLPVGFSNHLSNSIEPLIPPHQIARLNGVVISTPNGLYFADKVTASNFQNNICSSKIDIQSMVRVCVKEMLPVVPFSPTLTFSDFIESADKILERHQKANRSKNVKLSANEKKVFQSIGEVTSKFLPEKIYDELISEADPELIQEVVSKIENTPDDFDIAFSKCLTPMSK